MSFTSKNLQSKRGGMSFIKGATLFFLGMSCILFITKAFDITPVMNDVKGYFKTLIFTASGDNLSATGIVLDGINGDAYFKGTITGTTICLSGDSCITTWPAGGSSVWSTGTNVIYYNSGNVGIGTTGPTYKLDVAGTGRFANDILFSGQIASMIKMAGIGRRRLSILGQDYNVYGQTGGEIYINGGQGTSYGNVILANDGGNVGIGTTSPSAKLEIAGASGSVKIFNELSGGDSWSNISLNGDSNDYTGLQIGHVLGVAFIMNHDGPVQIGNLGVTRIAITASGDVGIGTTVPSAKLTVDGGIKPKSFSCGGGFPCSDISNYPEGTIFYNSYIHTMCYCGSSGTGYTMTGGICSLPSCSPPM